MRVLGISPFHDSSAAVICDGKIESFHKEERITRKKRDSHPFNAIDRCVKEAKGPIDIAVICSPDQTDTTIFVLHAYLTKMYKIPKVVDISDQHHLQHASLAFYNSGFDKAAVIVIDRNGSYCANYGREAESVFVAEYPCNFTAIYKNIVAKPNNASFLGKDESGCWVDATRERSVVTVYESATSLISQDALENGKTMGLAAYGKPDPAFPALFEIRNLVKDGMFDYADINGESQVIYLPLKDKITKEVTKENHQLYADFAFQVQIQTQEAVCKMIENVVNTTGIKKICLTGGYALNVVANNYYTVRFPDVEFYIEPFADDSGNSIGGAMYVYRNETQDTTVLPIINTFVNSDDYNLDHITGTSCTAEDLAKMLVDNKSVGVFNGVAEGGPRALGNRSILFNPCNPDAKDIINRIKNREWYRPFAAAVLEEDAHEFFEMRHIKDSPFMTQSFFVKVSKKKQIPGVIHVDNSCRIQTVNESNGHLYEILKEFKKLTGVGLLLNTSLNLAGEPLVDTPDQAIEMLDKTELDAVWFPAKSIFKTRN
jgi:carbamoyltransferase